MNRAEVRIRDPFILPVPSEGVYYMYGTTAVKPPDKFGFDTYTSTDLETWSGPFPVFRPKPNFWADRQFWAAEVYEYDGRYYMFATFKAPDRCRGTQVLVADSPKGPFEPHSDGPVTPAEFEALDGTLFIEDGVPWMVFCREWLQVHDGEIWAMPLKPDLSEPAGEPVKLFSATDAPWARVKPDQVDFVTDGPFLYRAAGGKLFMLWSSGTPTGYGLGVAYSKTGRVIGPWVHEPVPLYTGDGGHGMLFYTFDGRLTLSLHAPNKTPHERALFIPVEVRDGDLVLIS